MIRSIVLLVKLKELVQNLIQEEISKILMLVIYKLKVMQKDNPKLLCLLYWNIIQQCLQLILVYSILDSDKPVSRRERSFSQMKLFRLVQIHS